MIRLPLWLLVLLVLEASVAHAATYRLTAGKDLIGEIGQAISRQEDTLFDIARRHGLGYWEIRRVNREVDILLPGEGTSVQLPSLFILPQAPREGIVVNLAEMRLYYYQPAGHAPQVVTFPVAVGRRAQETPLGMTKVVAKVVDPAWVPPPSIRDSYLARGVELPDSIPPGPDNPLGKLALRLEIPGYLLHGTNKPDGIGMRVSYGCIRLFPEDIESLYELVSVDTEVLFVDQPYKVGWLDETLYLEVHPPSYVQHTARATALVKAIVQATTRRQAIINWDRVDVIRAEANGIPQPIGQLAPAQ